MIYFIWAKGTPFVKVGFTSESAELRRDSLSAGCPHELEVIYTFSLGSYHADRIAEKRVHVGLALEGRHVRGEWFNLPEPAEQIQEIIKPYLDPNTWRESRTVRRQNGRECITISREAARLAGLINHSHVVMETRNGSLVITTP